MKLVSLKIEAKGLAGWESPELTFAERATSIFAPNGSGKTPVVQSIAFCLGYPTLFREDINAHCAAATLTVNTNGRLITIRRTIQREFHVVVRDAAGAQNEFFSEGEFSQALFRHFGMEVPTLVSTGKEATHPYLSTVLPIFYLVQDGGYGHAYHPPRPFITDQFVEMVRFVFGLAPKHSFQMKKDLLSTKDGLEFLNERIVQQQKTVAELSKGTDDGPETVQRLASQSEHLQRHLVQLRESINIEGSAKSAFAESLASKDAELRAVRTTAEDLRQRIAGIEGIRAEIDAEIETLSLNEESKRLFESFEEICRNPDCGLFIGSSEAYAKNLLYLKDQIKDLERNTGAARIRLADLEAQLHTKERERAALASTATATDASGAVDQLVAAIQQVTVSLFNLEQSRGAIRVLSEARSKLLQMEAERDRLQDRIANLSNAGRADIAFNKLRVEVKDAIVRWLDVLRTLNVSRDIEIDLDFRMKFGGEPLEAITGSTRIRVVLAIHAALLELYLKDPSRPFRFIVLDTPKQQEMQTKDLAEFLTALATVCGEHNAQLVFSSTEYRFPLSTQDVEWLPTYAGQRQSMYLGTPPASQS